LRIVYLKEHREILERIQNEGRCLLVPDGRDITKEPNLLLSRLCASDRGILDGSLLSE